MAIYVALRKESVDRNLNRRFRTIHNAVALRKESVDRNLNRRFRTIHNAEVALRKESVDRNSINLAFEIGITTSLSARRAWIEIAMSNGK